MFHDMVMKNMFHDFGGNTGKRYRSTVRRVGLFPFFKYAQTLACFHLHGTIRFTWFLILNGQMSDQVRLGKKKTKRIPGRLKHFQAVVYPGQKFGGATESQGDFFLVVCTTTILQIFLILGS